MYGPTPLVWFPYDMPFQSPRLVPHLQSCMYGPLTVHIDRRCACADVPHAINLIVVMHIHIDQACLQSWMYWSLTVHIGRRCAPADVPHAFNKHVSGEPDCGDAHGPSMPSILHVWVVEVHIVRSCASADVPMHSPSIVNTSRYMGNLIVVMNTDQACLFTVHIGRRYCRCGPRIQQAL